MRAPALGAQGRRQQRGETKDALPRRKGSTPPPKIPPSFEIKVTVRGPLYFLAAPAREAWRSSPPTAAPRNALLQSLRTPCILPIAGRKRPTRCAYAR